MLSAVVTNENLIEALFINNERTFIDVVYRSEDNLIRSYTIDVDPDDIDFQYLLEITNLDEIEEFTAKAIEAEYQAIEEVQRHILANQSHEKDTKNDLSSLDILKFILFFDEKEISNDKTNEERLFSLKIACFDIEEIENGNDELKEQIRNAETPLELLNVIYDNLYNERSDL
jgi:hypothetical protein